MNKLAFVYAGQGSQKVGMGRDLYAQYPAFRAVFDRAPVHFDLKALCFDGPEETLSRTEYTQPCMVAFAAGVTAVLYENGTVPDYAAGLSLGEYSALHAAGAFDAETAIDLVAFRGRAMTEAAKGLDCGMQAVLGLAREPLQAACDAASALGVCEIANYNCPGQLVIAGEAAAVEKAAALAKEAGAKRCVPLNVSGPFHTSLMHPAGEALAKHFQDLSFSPLRFPVVHNATGKPLQDGETIAGLLETQVQRSVYLEDSIRWLAAQGVDTIVEIGPGRAISGFIRKIDKTIKTYAIEDCAGLEAVLNALKGA
ncbi:MAG: ACP S-malonyltransferase [Butyricicoccus sp.]|nr:ACP S-malonyltransferase [Butyricicoccus sp.]